MRYSLLKKKLIMQFLNYFFICLFKNLLHYKDLTKIKDNNLIKSL